MHLTTNHATRITNHASLRNHFALIDDLLDVGCGGADNLLGAAFTQPDTFKGGLQSLVVDNAHVDRPIFRIDLFILGRLGENGKFVIREVGKGLFLQVDPLQ